MVKLNTLIVLATAFTAINALPIFPDGSPANDNEAISARMIDSVQNLHRNGHDHSLMDGGGYSSDESQAGIKRWGQTRPPKKVESQHDTNHDKAEGWGKRWGQSQPPRKADSKHDVEEKESEGWGKRWGQTAPPKKVDSKHDVEEKESEGWGKRWGHFSSSEDVDSKEGHADKKKEEDGIHHALMGPF